MNGATAKVPALRFSRFNSDWKQVTLGSICSLITKGTTPEKFTDSGVNFVKIESLLDGVINIELCSSIDIETHQTSLKRSKLESGDILFAIAGATIGKVARVNEAILPANTNQALAVIRLNEKDCVGFVTNCLNSVVMKKYIYQNISVGAQPNISLGQLSDFTFHIPSIQEQQKIADFLSAVDEKIRLLKEKHALLQQYKKGVMQKLFSQEIRFKDDKGQAFPDWQQTSLSKLSQKCNSKNTNSSVRRVLTNSAKSGIVPQGDYFSKDIANQGNLEGYTVVQLDDFVYNPRISELAPVGPISRNHVGEGVMSPLYTVFKLNEKGLLDYVEKYFSTSQWHRYMHSVANFGARHDRMNISSADFYSLPIPIPSKPERDKIVELINTLDAKVDAVKKQIELTQTFKKGLLQQMFV